MHQQYKRIRVWLNEREVEHFQKQVAISGLKAEPFLRRLIMGAELKPRPPSEYASILREISAIGNNINQIAHIANTNRRIDPERIAEVQALVSRIWGCIWELS